MLEAVGSLEIFANLLWKSCIANRRISCILVAQTQILVYFEGPRQTRLEAPKQWAHFGGSIGSIQLPAKRHSGQCSNPTDFSNLS